MSRVLAVIKATRKSKAAALEEAKKNKAALVEAAKANKAAAIEEAKKSKAAARQEAKRNKTAAIVEAKKAKAATKANANNKAADLVDKLPPSKRARKKQPEKEAELAEASAAAPTGSGLNRGCYVCKARYDDKGHWWPCQTSSCNNWTCPN